MTPKDIFTFLSNFHEIYTVGSVEVILQLKDSLATKCLRTTALGYAVKSQEGVKTPTDHFNRYTFTSAQLLLQTTNYVLAVQCNAKNKIQMQVKCFC